MNILIATQIFYPEYGTGALRMTTLATELAKKGHQVTVLCPYPTYPSKDLYLSPSTNDWGLYADGIDKLNVVRISTPTTSDRFSKIQRIRHYLSFCLKGRRYLRHNRNFDIIIATSPQLLTPLIAVQGKRYGIPFIFDVRDLWPKMIYELKIFRLSLIHKTIFGLEHLILKKCDAICINSPWYRTYLKMKAPDKVVHYIPNMIPDAVFSLSQQRKNNRCFKIGYAGNFGLAQEFDTLLQAANLIKNDSSVRFRLIGFGSCYPLLQEKIRSMNLTNVDLYPAIARRDIPDFLNDCNVCYVGIKGNAALHEVSPGKIGEFMSLGKPILLVSKGISRKIVSESGAGIGIDPGDVNTLISSIYEIKNHPELQEQFAENAHSFAKKHYSASALVDEYESLLKETISHGKKKHH